MNNFFLRMFKIVFVFSVLFTFHSFAQSIQICSSKDSLPVSFATISIKNSSTHFAKTSNDKGHILIKENLINDTSVYEVCVHAIGFEKTIEQYKGIDLNKIKRLYILPSHLNLNEVVITAQYAPTIAEKSVQKIQIIDKEKIQQMGAANLKDVFTNQLNVRLQQDNVLGAGMNLQGISGENVKILVDGVPLIGRMNGNIDLSQINVNNIERIEFIEGPLSVQYGTNALAGTINIITKNSSTKKISAGANAYYESIGTYNAGVDFNLALKKHNVQFNAGRNYFDGWNPGDDLFYFPKPHIADSTRYKQWKPKEQYFGNIAYSYTFKKLNIGFKSAYFDEKIINRGMPRSPYAETSFDDYYFTKRFDNNVFFNGTLSKNWTVKALAAYNYYDRIKKTVFKDLTTLEEQLSQNSSDQDTNRFSLLMSRASFVHYIDSSNFNYEVGYDVNYESALGKKMKNNVQYMGDYAAFVTVEYKLFNKLLFKPGLRYAYNTIYKSPLIPSLNIKLTVNEKHAFRASYAKGFRAPSLKELYFLFVDINHNIIGNSNLKAENSNNFSLSYQYRQSFNKIRFMLDASLFYNDIYNLISLVQITGTEYSFINIGKYKTLGFQMSNTLKVENLSFQTGFNYTGRYNDLVSSKNNVPEFSFSPEFQENISYKLIKHKLVMSLFYKYNGKLPGFAKVNDEIIQTSIQDYHTLDASITKQFFKKDRVGLTIGCKNIFDVRNISTTLIAGGVHSSSSSSMPLSTGRNYFIKLAINICKE